LDARLPLNEPYRIPASTARAIHHAQATGGRIIAIGTTVVRALEHAAMFDNLVPAGEGLATQRIGPSTRLQIVDAILSGTHEPDTSHYEVLRAFVDDQALERMNQQLNAHGYRSHEFGDSIFIERTSERMGATWSTASTGLPRTCVPSLIATGCLQAMA